MRLRRAWRVSRPCLCELIRSPTLASFVCISCAKEGREGGREGV